MTKISRNGSMGIGQLNIADTVSVDLDLEDPENVVGRAASVVLVLITVIGIIGNTLVIGAVIKSKELQKTYNAYIAGLAVTNLMMDALVIPFYIDSYLLDTWRWGMGFCEFHTYFGTMLLCASPMHVACIAISRYCLIVFPHKRHIFTSIRLVVSKLAIIWLLSFCIVFPGILGYGAEIGYTHQMGRCNYIRSKSRFAINLIFICGVITPYFIMVLCYACITYKIKKSQRRLTKISKHAARNGVPIAPKLTRENSSEIFTLSWHANAPVPLYKENTVKGERTIAMLVVFFYAYMITYLPFTVTNLSDGHGTFPRSAYMPTAVVCWASTCINPWIYGFMSRRYREAYQQILCQGEYVRDTRASSFSASLRARVDSNNRNRVCDDRSNKNRARLNQNDHTERNQRTRASSCDQSGRPTDISDRTRSSSIISALTDRVNSHQEHNGDSDFRKEPELSFIRRKDTVNTDEFQRGDSSQVLKKVNSHIVTDLYSGSSKRSVYERTRANSLPIYLHSHECSFNTRRSKMDPNKTTETM